MSTPTPKLGFNLPTVNADENIWGGLLNDNWSDVDDYLDPAFGSTTSLFLSKQGGTVVGPVTRRGTTSVVDYYENTSAIVDQKNWRELFLESLYQIEPLDDDGNTGTGGYLRLVRSGTDFTSFSVRGAAGDPVLINVDASGGSLSGSPILTTSNLIASIPNNSIDGDKLISGSIDTVKYANASVTTAKINIDADLSLDGNNLIDVANPVNPTDGMNLTYANGNYGRLGIANAWSAANSFNAGITITGGASLTSGNLDFGGGKATNLGNPTAGSDGMNLTYANGNYGRLATSNTWTTLNVFSGGVRRSTDPTISTDLIHINYGDVHYGRLAVGNAWGALNTFNAGLNVAAGGATVSGGLAVNAGVVVNGGGLTVTGTTTLNNVTNIIAGLTVSGVITGTLGADFNSNVTIQGNLTFDTVGESTIRNSGTNLYLESTGGSIRSVTIKDTTTASAANMFVNTTNNNLMRSTSSGAYKTNKVPLVPSESTDRVLALIPTMFQSTLDSDDPERIFVGFYTEDVRAAMPNAAPLGDDNYDLRSIVAELTASLQHALARISELEAA